MKTIKKNVYYCDFCKKKGLSASAMTKHEKHCTGNLDRECRMCGFLPDYRKIIATITPFVEDVPEPEHPFGDAATAALDRAVAEVMDKVEGCPACCLTILRATTHLLPPLASFQFKYKDEVEAWWEERNDENAPDYSDIQ